MVIRQIASTPVGIVAARALRDLNARHPWSHNDHFHSWILANLPENRRSAIDIGCGHGALVAALSPHFAQVCGTEVDPTMLEEATRRCEGLGNVMISATDLSECSGTYDLITMVAVLHHLDVGPALAEVRRLLAPGGRFLVVGLAKPQSLTDHAWDMVSMVTNPLIGYVKHPWPSPAGVQPPPFPVKDPSLSFDQLKELVLDVMPGAEMKHHIGFRHTIAWTNPE